MPNFDKTGPQGKGSLTGGGLGGCSNKDLKNLKDMGFFKDIPKKPMDGRGMGRGMGRGLSNRNKGT